jgi:hypothetical protein
MSKNRGTRVLERLFQKIFVSIVPVVDGHEILTVAYKNKKILYKDKRHFEGNEPSNAMNRYIQEAIDPSPIYYISTINMQPHQGAHAGCLNSGKTQHSDDTKVSEVCRNKKWTLYASLDDLHALTYEYHTVGLDFIFSPFSILEHTFADKINDTFALYAFSMPGLFSIAVFDGGTLEYAHHYAQKRTLEDETAEDSAPIDYESQIMESEDHEGLINLEDIEGLEDLDIIDDLDSLSDIADLDELEEVHEFSEDLPTNEEKRVGKERSFMIKGDLDSAAEDYQRFIYIQKTLQQFYSMDECRNRFVETVCIADSQGGSEELKRYLEEELFLNVLVRKADVIESIHALAIQEEEGL